MARDRSSASEEIRQLETQLKVEQLRTEIAQAKQQRAEAEAQARMAKMNALQASARPTPVEGKTTLEAQPSMGGKARVMVDRLLIRLGREVARRVKDVLHQCEPGAILILQRSDPAATSAALAMLQMRLEANLTALSQWLSGPEAQILGPNTITLQNKGLVSEVTSGIQLASGLVASVADVLALFRTDYELHTGPVATRDEALRAAVAGALVPEQAVVMPEQGFIADSALAKKLQQLLEYRSRLTQLAAPLDEGDESEPSKRRKQARRLLDALDAFIDSLLAAPSNGGPSLLERAMVEEHRQAGADYLLWVKTTSAGADRITSHSIWPGSNRWVRYRSGVSVYYRLTDRHGRVLSAGLLVEEAHARQDLAGDDGDSLEQLEAP